MAETEDYHVFEIRDGIRRVFKPGELVRPINSLEFPYVIAGYRGAYTLCQSFTMKSKERIPFENVRKALWFESRQYPHLRFCVKFHRGRFWFKMMETFEIDLKKEFRQPSEVYLESNSDVFNMKNGPLWRVKFLEEEVLDGFETTLIVPIQHCITDTFSFYKMFKNISDFLNKMSRSEIIEPELHPLAPDVEKTETNHCSFGHLFNYVCKTIFYENVCKNFSKVISVNGAFIPPLNRGGEFVRYFFEISENDTKKLLKNAKSSGVTMNSAILAAINFSVLSVAQEKKNADFQLKTKNKRCFGFSKYFKTESQDSTTETFPLLGTKLMRTYLSVNLRRHFPQEFRESYGKQVSTLFVDHELNLEDSKDFWKSAKNLQEEIYKKLSDSEHLKSMPLMILYPLSILGNMLKEKCRLKPTHLCHYSLTNMGNVTDQFKPYDNDSIEIIKISRSNNSRYTVMPFVVATETFRNRLQFDISFHSSVFSVQNGQAVHDKLKFFIENLCTDENNPNSM